VIQASSLRLIAWRALVAQFFDGPVAQAHLANINHVSVQYGGGKHANPIQALLLVGWLASCLGWQVSKAGVSGDVTKEALVMTGANRQTINITLRAVEPVEETPGSLVEVRLGTPDAEFVIAHAPSATNATVTTRLKNVPVIERVVPLATPSQAELLDQQLEVRGRDRIYEEALTLSARLVAL
jgi:glucose-6-phosphate dehydrogenase assembly protein OpcA